MICSNSFFIDYSSSFFAASFYSLVKTVVSDFAVVEAVLVDAESDSFAFGTSLDSSGAVVTIIFGTTAAVAASGTDAFGASIILQINIY